MPRTNHRAEALATEGHCAGLQPASRWSPCNAATRPEDTRPTQANLLPFLGCEDRARSLPCQRQLSTPRPRSNVSRNSRHTAALRTRSHSGDEQLERFLGDPLRETALPEGLARVWSVSRGA